MHRILILVIAAAVVAVLLLLLVWYSAKLSKEEIKKKQEAKPHLTQEEAKILQTGTEKLLYLRRITGGIRDGQIRASGRNVCESIANILQKLEGHPERIRQMRQFFNYYLPTICEVFARYWQLEKENIPLEDVKKKLQGYLADVKAALGRQYDNLLQEDRLFMEVDMEAMTRTARRDGLLGAAEKEEKPEKKEENIRLTL